MKSISLLPSEYKKMKKSGRKRELLVAALGILTLIAVFAFIIIKIMSSIPGEKLKMLKAENENLLRSIQALDYLNELEESIDKEAALAQKAVGNQADWLTLYTAISTITPDGIQFTSIFAEPEEKKLTFIIQGSARSNTLLADWMERMKELPYFSGTELSYARASDESGQSFLFEMRAVAKNEQPFKLFEEAME